MATSQLLNDANIDHAIALNRYANGKAQTLLPYMREIVQYIEVRLGREGETIATQKALNKVKFDTSKKLNSIYSNWESDEFDPVLREVVKNELNFQDETIRATVDGYTPVLPPQKDALSAANNRPLLIGSKGGSISFGKHTTKWKPEEVARVSDLIESGFRNSLTTQEITRSIVGLKSQRYADGVLNVSRANIYSMVKTSVSHLSSSAKSEFSKQNSDLIIGERWISTLDVHTTPICADRDQTVYLFSEYGQNYPRPPAHYNCRSTMAPELNPEYSFLTESRTRPAVADGKAEQVPGTQGYYTWLKNQPKAVVDDALGPEKSKIFRNAGLSPSEFKAAATNQFSQPLTIEQMSQKDKKISSYLQKQG